MKCWSVAQEMNLYTQLYRAAPLKCFWCRIYKRLLIAKEGNICGFLTSDLCTAQQSLAQPSLRT